MNLDQHVVVVANYRTGSSNYTLGLNNEFKDHAHTYTEPTLSDHTYQDLVTKIENDSKCIVQFKADQLELGPIYKKLLDSKSYKILITRTDLLEQITSWYIARVRGVFFTNPWETEKNYSITPADDAAAVICWLGGRSNTQDELEKIRIWANSKESIDYLKKNCIKNILNTNEIIRQLNIEWNRIVTYEQLIQSNSLLDDISLRHKKPDNYDQIKESISVLLAQELSQ